MRGLLTQWTQERTFKHQRTLSVITQKRSTARTEDTVVNSSRLLKKILGEGSLPSPTSFLRAFSRNLYARIADFLAFGHTCPRTYAEGTTARFLIRTRL